MKKLYTILLFFFTSTLVLKAQPGVDYPIHKSGIWITHHLVGGPWGPDVDEYWAYHSIGDTTIGGNVYNKLYYMGLQWHTPTVSTTPPYYIYNYSLLSTPYYIAAYRNDSLARKSYIWHQDSTNEMLWYDFSLHISEHVPTMYSITSIPYNDYYVQTIDSNLMAGYYRKTFRMDTDSTTAEGAGLPLFHEYVGSAGDFLRHNRPYFEEYYSTQYCEDSVLGYFCDNRILSLNSIHNSIDFNLYPNPANAELTISIPVNIQGNIELSDVSGKVLLTLPIGNTIQINASLLPNGLYTCSIKNKDGIRVGHHKLIILH